MHFCTLFLSGIYFLTFVTSLVLPEIHNVMGANGCCGFLEVYTHAGTPDVILRHQLVDNNNILYSIACNKRTNGRLDFQPISLTPVLFELAA